MKKILLGVLLFISAVCADNIDAPDLVDDWYIINQEPAAIPNNSNPPGAIAPDPYKQPSLPYRTWEATKSSADWAFSKPAERAGNRAYDQVNQKLDDKVFDPWQEYNRKLETYVEQRKKNLEKEILALLYYYTIGR